MYKRPVYLGFLSILFTVFFSFGAFAVQCDSGTFIQDDACVTCPANSSSTENATECTCNVGHSINADGAVTTTTGQDCIPNKFKLVFLTGDAYNTDNTEFSTDIILEYGATIGDIDLSAIPELLYQDTSDAGSRHMQVSGWTYDGTNVIWNTDGTSAGNFPNWSEYYNLPSVPDENGIVKIRPKWKTFELKCNPGYFVTAQKDIGTGHCTTCTSGYYCPGFDEFKAVGKLYGRTSCPANSSSGAGQAVCTCNANFYQDGTTCVTCPANSTSAAGDPVCTCDIGYTADGQATTTTADCVFTPEFTIKTINMEPNTTFSFSISAAGNYTIDWDDGYSQKIVKTDTTATKYTHIYENGGEHTIGMAGDATNYDENTAAISFSSNKNIAVLGGSLGAIFGGAAQSNMFNRTFNACTSLQSIPENLFDGVTGAAENMFRSTFYSCSALSEIPSGLFDGVNGAADYMFSHTFTGCSALSEIPSGLFSGVTGAAVGMFQNTFGGCTSLQSIPSDLFSGVDGAANSMFSSTFQVCTSLQSIPSDLFSGVTGAAGGMFISTFSGCKSLQSIPVDLFANVKGAPVRLAFNNTFSGATNITKFVDANGNTVSRYVPEQFFGGLTQPASYNADMFSGAFANTGLLESCPTNTVRVTPYYANAIAPKVVCEPFTPEFTVKTINMAANTTFSFNLTAAGSYTIDWGDGYSQKIEKTDISVKTYKHTYATAGAYTIRMAGEATAYKENTAAISFSGNKNIAELDGSLGAIFSGPAHPYMFASTFQSCTNLTTIPETLFDGVTDAANYMFSSTFSGCTSLQSIPDTLFSGVTGAADYMFNQTFYGCSALSEIPSGLFSGVTGAAGRMFISTFYGCTSLQSIPGTLFDSVTGAADYMFSNTFGGCASLQSIPSDLFSGVIGAAENMFNYTFSGCTSLQSIPSGLFSGVLGAANYMFRSTFNGCTSLQSIPDTLFSGVTGAADYMFSSTFSGCTSLEEIPEDLFSGVKGVAESMFNYIFQGCTSLQSIPSGLFRGVSGAANSLFSYTFNGCTSLQSIPSGLFSGVSGAADYMFLATFQGCTNLTEIPSDLFSGVSGAANYMFGNTRGNPGTFADCIGLTSIPVDLFKTVTGEPGTNAFANLFYGATGITKFVDADGNTVSTYVPTQFFGGMDDTNAAAFTNAFTGTDLATECPDDYVNANPYYATVIAPKVVCKFNPEFTITTINMAANTTFSFNLTAAGSYVIDWGDGYIENITKDTVEYETISHTYTDAGVHTVGIAGQATQYSDNEWLAAVSFAWNEYVASISGSLGAIFGTLDNGDNPRFVDTFSGTKITNVPPELFDGITGTISNMFAYTFYNCKKLQTVHKDLFANVTKPAPGLFSGTFSDSGLVEVPIELFKNLGGTADSMFSYTFGNCANLEVLPVGLFDSVTEPAPGLFNGTFNGSGLKKIQSGVFDNLTGIADNLFGYTFSNCSKLISLPDALFKNITGAASGVFNGTFSGSGLVEIPSDLFSGITEAINGMFTQTFAYCTDLESVPVNLFENIAGTPNDWAFSMMFYGDTNLSTIVLKNGITHVDYVPRDFFGKMAIPEQNVFYHMFDETKLATQCPRGFIADKQLTEYLNYKAVCTPAPEPEIIIKTVEMLPGDTFAFHINAPGNYVVDWGEGPAMEYTHLDEISHTYLGGGTFEIGISGQQTSPMGSQSAPLPVISFQDNNFVKDVQGSFSAIFDQIEDYMFYETFNYCRELTNVDENLFQGINGATKGMFERTFASCYKLKEIPKGLFSNVSGTADNMFRQTFMDCYALTDVPTGLFDGINGAASRLFDGTFSFCKGLNSLPIDLFANVRGAADFLFHQTFMQCENLQNIPKGLFNGVNGAARDMFNYTFGGCRNITSIPTGLFDGVKGTAPFIFQGTFSDCEKLIEIPDDLFAGITSASEFMFAGTFYNCSNIKKLPNGLFKNISGKPGEMTFSSTFNSCLNMRGYIPVDTFANLDASDYVSGPMWGIFENTGLDTICPAGTYQYITGFEIDWSDKVSCAQCPYDGLGIPGETDSIAKCFKESECNSPAGFGTMRYYYNELTDSYDTPTECRFTQCNDGYYMLDGVCTDCPAGSYCTDDNIYSCPDGYTSDMRQDEQTDCYKNCKELDILYGIALPVNSIEIWPNDCEYQDCISTSNNVGTVVETKDGLICREYDCPYNQKMINGVCRPCDAEHAIEYDENAFENCTVKICEEGFEPYLDSCRPLQDACSAPYATKAYKYWDKTYASYGPCIIEECEAGRHIDANACELDVSPCDIKNGAGERVWNGTEWQECQIVQCEHGFTPDANRTACERCYNYFDENGDVAVSGYISECEIASCMYQGEKYILENNECRLICTNTTDETGSRYWNERTKKCEHSCAAGHMPW